MSLFVPVKKPWHSSQAELVRETYKRNLFFQRDLQKILLLSVFSADEDIYGVVLGKSKHLI